MSTATSSRPPATRSTEHELIDLRSQACNSLKAALHLLTDSGTTTMDSAVFARALARTLRATTALKRACAHAKGCV